MSEQYREYPAPTAPGWYWARIYSQDPDVGGSVVIVEVRADEYGGLRVLVGGYRDDFNLEAFTWHSGALPPLEPMEGR